jgi:hypothetical protein
MESRYITADETKSGERAEDATPQDLAALRADCFVRA